MCRGAYQACGEAVVEEFLMGASPQSACRVVREQGPLGFPKVQFQKVY